MSLQDAETAARMRPLLNRGRRVLRGLFRSYRKADRPIGGGFMHVVLRTDFVENVELCLSHVDINGALLHVLCRNGALCIVVEQRKSNW